MKRRQRVYQYSVFNCEHGGEEIGTGMPLKKRRTGGHGKMKVEIGEKFTNCLTGRVYRVGMINKEWVVLESEDGSGQVLTGRVGLTNFYSRSGDETRKRNFKRKEETYP